MTTWLALASFWGLVLLDPRTTLARARRERARHEWVLDLVGLAVQGLVVPVAGVALGHALRTVGPSVAGTIQSPGWLLFAVNVVLVDYLYYWNHRGLHSRLAWRGHVVHHGLGRFDVWGASRGSLWSGALVLYLWIHALVVWLAADPTGYLLGAAVTASLDLWRHSSVGPGTDSGLGRFLGRGLGLVLPGDHALHHGCEARPQNFGANFSWWDRIHGTWATGTGRPPLGLPSNDTLRRKLWWPSP